MKRWQRRTLGILDIGGGSLGIAISVMQVAQTGWSFSQLILALAIAMYAWGVACGVALFEDSPRAEHANFWFWLVQVPILTSPLASYLFTSGAFALVKINFWPPGYAANAMIGSQFNFSFNSSAPWGIGVNLLALGICWWLWRRLEPNHPAPAAGTSGTGAQAPDAAHSPESRTPEATP